MKNILKLAAVLGCAFSLHAQITAVLKRFPARGPEVEIRNDSTVNLTAFAIRMAPAPQAADPAPLLVYVDTAVDMDRSAMPYELTRAMPLAPGEEYGVAVPDRLREGRIREDLFVPPIPTAAVFADGTTAGDPALLARLMLRRCNMLQAVELAIEMLSDAGRHNVPRGQLIGQFKMMAESVRHWYLPPEQQVGRRLYEGIVGKLTNLPELQLGTAFPPTAFVEQETARLSRQRTMLLESRPNLAEVAVVPR
jgi:hypothetical protein